MLWKALATLCVIVSTFAAQPAAAQKKLALVIGIDAYERVPKLERAVADARAMAKVLGTLDFKVRVLENASRDAISAGFAAFEDEIDKGDTAFVFFAGHGVEIRGQNFLLPADAPLPNAASEGVLKDKGFLTPALIERVTDRGARAAFFVIDACRNNPYAQPGARRSIGSTRGLAKPEAPEGVFVLMSAGQNQEALDNLNTPQKPRQDSEKNSVFTRVFLDELTRPGLSHLQLAKNVQTRVRDLARGIGHAQVPTFTDQIIGEVVFRAGTALSVATPPTFSASRSAAPLAPTEERALKPKDAFTECADCPEMVVVPSGTFVRGSPADEAGRYSDEGPQRRVTISQALAVGKFEVTFAQWDECVLDSGCAGHRPTDEGWGRGKQPVINVSWNDAQTYVTWLSRKTGKTYRLLTEAEWEYAARAGTTTPFSFGATISPDDANYNGSAAPYGNGRTGVYRKKAIPVGSFRANAFGLFDMHGNVWEWVADCEKDSYATAPADGRVSATSDCSRRIVRGGTWDSYPQILRSAYRNSYRTDGRNNLIGFRVARTLNP